jgi:hypothetical protein
LCGIGPLQNVEIDLQPKSGRLRNGSAGKFTVQSLLLTFSVPQFFFTSRRPMTFWERQVERRKSDWVESDWVETD